jgi:Sec-independent protein translocase protein TatA
MMSSGIFLLFLGLIIFGPKKTMEFAQEIGRLLAHVKRAAGQFTSLDVISASEREGSADVRAVALDLERASESKNLSYKEENGGRLASEQTLQVKNRSIFPAGNVG